MLSCLSQGVDGNFVLSGRKDFVTLAGEADTLFVAVTEGESQGRSNIKMVMVKVSTPGVDVVLHPPLSFVPNVSHGSVTFDSVVVNAGDIFSGDGYSEYVKPFRWFEDINVFTSVAAYLFKLTLAYDWKVEARVEIISILISLSYLQKIDAGDSIAHIVMSDLVKRLERWLECYDKEWEKVPEAVSNEWSRDKLLLKIASSARKVRHGNAIDKLLLNNVA